MLQNGVGEGYVVGSGDILLIAEVLHLGWHDEEATRRVGHRRHNKIGVSLSLLRRLIDKAQAHRLSEVGSPFCGEESADESRLLVLLQLDERPDTSGLVVGHLRSHITLAVDCTHGHIGQRVDRVGVATTEVGETHWTDARREGIEEELALSLGVAKHVVARAVETIPFGIGFHCPAQDNAVAIGAAHGFNIDVEILYGVIDTVPGEGAHGIGARQQIVIIGFLHDGVADSHAQGGAPWDSRCPREHTRHAHGGSQKPNKGLHIIILLFHHRFTSI